jgi:hypothetical protein
MSANLVPGCATPFSLRTDEHEENERCTNTDEEKNRGPVEREKNGRRETVRESREQREQNNRKRKSNEQEGSLKRGVSPIHSSKVSAKPGKFFLLPAL